MHPTHPTALVLPLTRTVALAALLSAPLAAIPWIAAHADPATGAAVQLAQAAPTTHPAAANPASERPDTVEQRITDLHQALKITPDEEKKWNDVAQAMRDNAANMEKLIAEKRKQAPHDMTAIDDLETYQKFAQAHVDGLKNLTSAFKSLYSSMPDPQKKNADQVFENFHKTPNSGRG